MLFNNEGKRGAVFKRGKLCLFIIFVLIISTLLSIGCSADFSDSGDDKTRVASRFYEIFLAKSENNESGGLYLIPGGDAFGIKIRGTGVTVSKIPDGQDTPLKVADRIKRYGGRDISTLAELRAALAEFGAAATEAVVEREGRLISLTLTPTLNGLEYTLGVILEEGARGIGTITYIDPKTGCFGGLGHGISSPDGKEILPMTDGSCTGVILGGAVRGAKGKPGELRGVLTDEITGEIYKNTECGIFGRFSPEVLSKYSKRTSLPIAKRSEVKEGDAEIITTIKNGRAASYSIKIEDIDYTSRGSKSFKISVCDDALVALSGGIVRGMSGSPIIQNGKIVGAVTHVLVANPTEGYGIFIENMLSAAQQQALPKAA